MIGEKERYHGIVLHRLVTASAPGVALRRISGLARSAYVVDGRVALYLKYSTNRITPWPFVFGDDQRRDLDLLASTYERVELVLVCGNDGIIGLNFASVAAELKDGGENGGFFLQVKRRRGQRYRVTGVWPSEIVVSEAAFPRIIFSFLDSGEYP